MVSAGGNCRFCSVDKLPVFNCPPRECRRRTTSQAPQTVGGVRKAVSAETHAHFARDMRKGEVIELHDAEHGDFLTPGPVQTRSVREIQRFLFSQ